jgi:hypothetical protein
VDETSIWINEGPLYHMRLRGTRPVALPLTSGSKKKLNVWAGISMRGCSNIEVNRIEQLNLISLKKEKYKLKYIFTYLKCRPSPIT